MTVEGNIEDVLIDALAKASVQAHDDIRLIGQECHRRIARRGGELVGSGLMIDPTNHTASAELVIGGKRQTISI